MPSSSSITPCRDIQFKRLASNSVMRQLHMLQITTPVPIVCHIQTAACLHAILEALAAVKLVQQHRHEAVAVGLQEVVPAGGAEWHLPQRRLRVRRPHLQGIECTVGVVLPLAQRLVRMNGAYTGFAPHMLGYDIKVHPTACPAVL
jgi:hypothetical protein